MTAFRIPGSLGIHQQPESLEDGTLARILSPLPGPLCGYSRPYCATPDTLISNVTRDPVIASLFTQCRSPKLGLAESDFERAARTLLVEVTAIKAVADVEAKRGAFDEEGRPTILFERHKFHQATAGRHDRQNPRVSNPLAGGYGKFSSQYPKLEEAWQLDPERALQSASWGRFQIMGSNYQAAGYSGVFDFVRGMMISEANHLDAFVAFIQATPAAHKALQTKNWAKFAGAYNGPRYKDNDYDTKMRNAYEAFAAATRAAD